MTEASETTHRHKIFNLPTITDMTQKSHNSASNESILPMTSSSRSRRYINKSLPFKLFIIGMVLLYLDLVRNAYMTKEEALILPYIVAIIIKLSIIILFGASAGFAYLYGQSKNIKPIYRMWLYLIFIHVLFLTFYGILRGNGIREIILDFGLFMMMFAAILAGSNKNNWLFFDKFIVTFFFLNTVLTIISFFDILQGEIFNPYTSGHVFSSKFYYFWGELSIWPYFLLTIRDGSLFRKIVAYTGITTFFVSSIILSKRSPFIILFLLISVIVFKTMIQMNWIMKFKQLSGNIVRLLIFGIILIIVIFGLGIHVYMGDTIEKLEERFFVGGSISESVLQDPRIEHDSELVFGRFSDWELLFGQGGGAMAGVPDPGAVGERSNNNDYVLHNGMLFIIQKGGILFLMIWIMGWFHFVKDFFIIKNTFLNRYFAPASVIFLFSFVTGFMGWGTDFPFLMMIAGRGMIR